MAAAAERVFRKSLQTQSFDRAYYLFGEEEFLKEDALRQLIAAAVEPATREFNLDVRDGATLDAETIGSLLGTPPMMAERRVVIVKNTPALKKDARGALEKYLKAPAADVLLVMLAGAGEKNAADKLLMAAATPVEFEPLTGDRVAKWIVHQASQGGVTIAPGAAELLQQTAGNDLPALAAELDKLASYTNGAEITEQAVADVVGVRRGESLGDLLDCVAARDAAGALRILPHVLMQPKVNGVTIVMALTTHMLALAYGSAVRGRVNYFDFLKLGSAFTGRSWGDAAAAWQRQVNHWSAAELDAALEALLAADRALKDTRAAGDEQLLTSLVLSLCAGPAART